MRVLSVLVTCLVLIALMAGCEDPPPGEISVQAYKNGKRQNCVVELWKVGGTQIDKGSGSNGLTYLKQIAPGAYTLKFSSYEGEYYKAVVEVEVSPGDSMPLQVELTKEGQSALIER